MSRKKQQEETLCGRDTRVHVLEVRRASSAGCHNEGKWGK